MGGVRVFHSFHKGISPKVNVIAELGFEPAYYDVALVHISFCTILSSPLSKDID